MRQRGGHEYTGSAEALEAKGSLVREGERKGVRRDSLMPDALLRLELSDGYFSYPDLPKDVSDVQIGLVVNYNGTDADLTTIDHFGSLSACRQSIAWPPPTCECPSIILIVLAACVLLVLNYHTAISFIKVCHCRCVCV